MFHAVYVGHLSSLNIKVKGAPAPVEYPLTLLPCYPQSIPDDTASAVQIQWGPGWTDYMMPVYVPTEVPGTGGQLYINWSPDDQLIVLMDEMSD